MSEEMVLLYGLAVGLGFTHTILGPDHYVPFIALSRAGGWTLRRTLLITLLCGVAHVLSSVALGLIGLGLGTEVVKLENIESARGRMAGWLLLGFGLAYTVWAVRRAIRLGGRRGVQSPRRGDSSSWGRILFVVFVFGPCEPLIPLLMVPAAHGHWANLAIVSVLFGLTTLLTMLGMVAASVTGLSWWGARWAGNFTGRYGPVLAGLAVLACGGAIQIGL